MGRRGAKAGRKRRTAPAARVGGSAIEAIPNHVRAWRAQPGPPAHIVARQQAHLQRMAARRQTAVVTSGRTAAFAPPEAPQPSIDTPSTLPQSAEPAPLPAYRPRPPRPTSVPSIASRPIAATGAPPAIAAAAPSSPSRSSRGHRIAAAILLAPTLAVAGLTSFVMLRRDIPALVPTTLPREARLPLPVPTARAPLDVAIALPPNALPPIRWPTEAPSVPDLGGNIRFSELRLPVTPPRVTAIRPRPRRDVLVPEAPFSLAPQLPPELAERAIPPMPEIAAVQPLGPPQPTPPIAVPNLPPPVVTDAPVCVAAPGYTLARPAAVAMPPRDPEVRRDAQAFGMRLASAARAQIDQLVVYDARYSRIAYPRGDVSPFFGVCTDVVVRAYRALGIDLQESVAEARVGTGDRNIDHRRTEVVRRFLARAGESLPISEFAEEYLPGDIVTYYRPQNRSSTSHIAIVSDVIAPSGRPMIVHNRGWGVQLEDALFVDKITGHYRYSGPPPGQNPPATLIAARTDRSNTRGETLLVQRPETQRSPAPGKPRLSAVGTGLAPRQLP